MPKTLAIKPARSVRRNRNRALALEPRMLFDGALAVDAAATVHADTPSKAVDVPAAVGEKPANDRLAESAPAAGKTIVFVDYRVANADQLLAGVDPAATVVKIGQGEDGVQTISDTLARAQDIASVQIVSHGGPGFIELGKTKLDQQGLTGAYAAAIAGWREAMTADGDLLLLGCDVAQGTRGAAFIAALAQATQADVAASIGPTGSAALGGDWLLESATGTIESKLAFADAALGAYDGLLANALPDVQIVGMPAVVKLGETFNFTLRFDNADPTQVGFGPYVTLWVPVTGPDGAGAAADDGLTVNSFTYLGQAVDPSLITTINLAVGAGGTVVHPFAKDASGSLINITVPTGFQAGDKLYIVKLPFGSFTPAQPVADIVVNATLSQDMDVDKTLGIRAGGGFQYGNDALDNPTTPDPALLAADVTATINPTLFKITSAINSPEGETATGGNFLNTLTVTVDVAPGQTLTNFDLLQSLPLTGANNGEIVVTNISATGGGVVTPAFVFGTTSLTQSNYTNANSTYTVHWGSLTGTQTITVTYFVPKTDQGGTDIIDPVSANDVAIQFGGATSSGGWTPHDVRDPISPVNGVDTNPAPTVTAKALAIQKGVGIAVDTGAAGVTPGDTLEYTINFQVSDYFAFDDLTLRDIIGDGQLVVGTPTLSFQQDGATFGALAVTNVVATANPDKGNGAQPGNIYDGASILDFDLAAEFSARGLTTGSRIAGDLFSNAMGGTHNTVHQSGTTGQLKFQALIDDHYTDKFGAGYGGDSRINQSDNVDNTIRDSVTDGFHGGVLSVVDGTTIVASEADGTGASSTIRSGSFSLTIYGRQDSSLAPIADLTQMNPGDYITYRLTYNLSEGDFENLKLASFLPLPVFDATDPDANDPAGNNGPAWTFDATTADGTNAGTALPAVAQYKWAPSQSADYLGLTPTVTADDNANKITWDFGSRDNAINLPRTIDILFTVR
ncbi:MAG: DUF4347 domain-containing protein, partial [Betaproteobacteria bacterium]|nr:DUF4347 domain-containing protein [Betaproteobacteria bacterium]